jgi:hypothetical protein
MWTNSKIQLLWFNPITIHLWANTSFSSSVSEVKTGKWSGASGGNNSGAADGAHEHPYWRKTVTPTSLHIWDVRNYGHYTAQ